MFKIFSKKLNFSIDKLRVGMYIIAEKDGKRPMLSIRSDNLQTEREALSLKIRNSICEVAELSD